MKEKHQLHKKHLDEIRFFQKRLPNANEKMEEISYSVTILKHKTVEDLNNKLQNLKGKTSLEFNRTFSN